MGLLLPHAAQRCVSGSLHIPFRPMPHSTGFNRRNELAWRNSLGCDTATRPWVEHGGSQSGPHVHANLWLTVGECDWLRIPTRAESEFCTKRAIAVT
eukprot:15461945-Alexandrium_andersonii.AAC.1